MGKIPLLSRINGVRLLRLISLSSYNLWFQDGGNKKWVGVEVQIPSIRRDNAPMPWMSRQNNQRSIRQIHEQINVLPY